MAYYKVWIEIERVDEENDEYEEVDLGFGSAGEFPTENQAIEFAEKLQAYAEEQ